MGNCSHCKTFVLFGGVQLQGLRYCSESCAQLGQLARVAQTLPDREIRKHVWDTYKGDCPCCGGAGPVDVRMSYRGFSALFSTRWTTHSQLACRSCGVKAQLLSLLFCLLLGWWGFPWGLLVTPVQIIRNLVGLLVGDSGTPSDTLDRIVRLRMAERQAAVPPAPSTLPKAS